MIGCESSRKKKGIGYEGEEKNIYHMWSFGDYNYWGTYVFGNNLFAKAADWK